MTQEEINDYNRRCAEFLGLKRGWWISQQKPLTDDKKQWCDLDGKTFLGSKVYFDKDLKFHSDWNWIMEVVEAIEKLDIDKNKFSSHPFYQGFNLENNTYYAHVQFGEDLHFNGESRDNKKEAVVQAINQFLIWYKNEPTNT